MVPGLQTRGQPTRSWTGLSWPHSEPALDYRGNSVMGCPFMVTERIMIVVIGARQERARDRPE
jgi:hypothetical protein